MPAYTGKYINGYCMSKYIIDSATRHQIFLQRYADGKAREARRGLNRLRRKILARLSQSNTEFQSNRLGMLLADIDNLLLAGYADIGNDLRAELGKLATSEANFGRLMINKAFGADFVLPNDEILAAVVDSSVIGTSKLGINDALQQLSSRKQKQIRNIIVDGVALGDSPQKIKREVHTIMNTLHRRQVSALVHTSVNHVSSVARDALYRANDRLMDGYEWVSTLDSRTTLICGSRDGQVYQVGQGPMPPAHWNCRSTTVPHIAGSTKGMRPSVVQGKAKQVKASTNYGAWLKKQPIEFIDEALGPERSKLFRQGKLALDKFVDPTGRVYTLKQLESMNPFVFQEI